MRAWLSSGPRQAGLGPRPWARIEGERHCCLESQKTAVWYTYSVDGTQYGGATTDLPHLSADQVQEAVELHKSVPVHYDPQRPQISVLDPGFMRAGAIWLLGGFLYVGVGIAGIWRLLGLKRDVGQVRLRHAA